jgi:hypothetical protein
MTYLCLEAQKHVEVPSSPGINVLYMTLITWRENITP